MILSKSQAFLVKELQGGALLYLNHDTDKFTLLTDRYSIKVSNATWNSLMKKGVLYLGQISEPNRTYYKLSDKGNQLNKQ